MSKRRFYFITKYFAIPYFFILLQKIIPWLLAIFWLLFISGCIDGFFFAPIDYQQADAVKIMYIHVPAAIISLFSYLVLFVHSCIYIIWRIKLALLIAYNSAILGFVFTALTLITGSLWGKPMWGTWWIWDPRLTAEFILLCIYGGYIMLYNLNNISAREGAQYLAIIGFVNIPIIHYSVYWWQSLHQQPTLFKFSQPSITLNMLMPLLFMLLAFIFLYLSLLALRLRNNILQDYSEHNWLYKNLHLNQ